MTTPHPALEPQAQRPVRHLPFAGGSLQTIATFAADAALSPVLAGLERDLVAFRAAVDVACREAGL